MGGSGIKFLLLAIPTLIISSILFIVFGWLGLCTLSDCLGTGQISINSSLVGGAVITLASIPMAIQVVVLRRYFKGQLLGRKTLLSVRLVAATIGGFGLFQVIVDPSDAFWAGLPMIIFAGFFALSTSNFPNTGPSEPQ